SPRSVPEAQQRLLARVDEAFLAGDGFGVPTRSALLSLINPDRYAIVDRWSFAGAIATTGGAQRVVPVESALGAMFPDHSTDRFRLISKVEYAIYLDALELLRGHARLDTRTCERALYRLAQKLGVGDGTWGDYREAFVDLLFAPKASAFDRGCQR